MRKRPPMSKIPQMRDSFRLNRPMIRIAKPYPQPPLGLAALAACPSSPGRLLYSTLSGVQNVDTRGTVRLSGKSIAADQNSLLVRNEARVFSPLRTRPAGSRPNGLGRTTRVFVPSCSRVLCLYPARPRGAGEEP